MNIEQTTKAEKCRDYALCELVETEKTYVNGLAKLIIIYIQPLKEDDNGIISISDHQTIFPSAIYTIYNLHNQLLAELDYTFHQKHDIEQESMTCRIGKVLIKYSELFKMYTIYLQQYERAQKALSIIRKKNKKFTRWLRTQYIKTSLSAGDLENLLILPIQRIPRYQLLLKEIIKQTEKICAKHNDLNDLNKTYQQILDITKLIESKMRDFDRKQKVALIANKFGNLSPSELVTPSRFYISESKKNEIRIYKQDGSSFNIILFLFNDCLLYGHDYFDDSSVSNISFGRSSNCLYFDHFLHFDVLFKLVVNDDYKKLHSLLIYSRDYSIWIAFKTKKLRTKWLKLINNANTNCNKLHLRNLQRNIMSKECRKQSIAYPCFIPDDYSKNCMQCNVKFTFTNRKHHCKQCGLLLCGECTNYRMNSMFNKYKKNQIIRCCKKCKKYDTKRRRRKQQKNEQNEQMPISNYALYQTLKFEKNNARHMRTHSSPSIKSPPLKSLQPHFAKHKSSTNPRIKMLEKNGTKKEEKMMKICLKPTLHKTKSLKLFNVNVVRKQSDKYLDKMPQSPHLNPPQEHGYNNDDDDDDSMDDEIDDEDKSHSFEELEKSPSLLDISAPNIVKFIKVIPPSNVHRRTRSYAVGLKQESNLCVPSYCTVTDDDEVTTDFDVFSASSGDIKDSPFRKKAKIIKNTCSFRQCEDQKLWC